jgi:hypothetical protein
MKKIACGCLGLVGQLRTTGVALIAASYLSTAFSAAAMAESALDEATPALTYPGDATCVVRNLRGAEYVGRAWGDYAMDRACHYAFDQCFRDSILPRTCHIVYQGPANFTGETESDVVPACVPVQESSCSRSTPETK